MESGWRKITPSGYQSGRMGRKVAELDVKLDHECLLEKIALKSAAFPCVSWES